MQSKWKAFFGLVAMFCIVIFAMFCHWYLLTPINASTTAQVYEISEGTTLREWAQDLHAKQLLDHPWLFEGYVRLLGQARELKAGEYELVPDMAPTDFLRKLVDGDVIEHAITLVEGWTAKEALAAIAANPFLKHGLANKSAQDIQTLLNLNHPLEGEFFPDTYHFVKGTHDLAILKVAHEVLTSHLNDLWPSRSVGLSYKTPYQALIVASIIEKESALPADRKKISGVIQRRLLKNMYLQVDPTVIYGLGQDYQGTLHAKDLKRVTPYNTYRHKGLPPTPIALASFSSLEASLQPAPGNSLYFVATDKGRHVFSASLKAHDKAIRQHLLRKKHDSTG